MPYVVLCVARHASRSAHAFTWPIAESLPEAPLNHRARSASCEKPPLAMAATQTRLCNYARNHCP